MFLCYNNNRLFKTERAIPIMYKKKSLFMLCIISICLLFSGCTLTGLEAHNLIEPPKSNPDQQAIHNLMRAGDADTNFIYPKRGDYRSAIITRDFNADTIADAMGFYANPDGGIYLKFMSELNGEWTTVSVFSNTAAQVDKVVFGDINGDNIEEIIVGWGSPQSLNASISVYVFENNKYNEYMIEHRYNEFIVADFNDDGVIDLFTSTFFVKTEQEEGEDEQAYARVYTFIDELKAEYNHVLNSTVVRYSSCDYIKVDNNQNAILLEGITAEGGLLTQLLYYSSNRIVSPLSYESLVADYNFFQRPSEIGVASKDIDGDGIYEFPLVRMQPYSTPPTIKSSYNYYVNWVKFDKTSYEVEEVAHTIMNIQDNFMLQTDPDREIIFLSKGNHTYTVKENVVNSEGNFLYEKNLFEITIVSSEDSEELESDAKYDMLFTGENNLVYYAKVFSIADDNIVDTIKLIN